MHSAGGLSSRQRCTFAPWRMRPSELWSKVISTTSSGRSATHSRSRPALQRDGSPLPALAGLVGLQEADELALLLLGEAAGVPDLAQPPVGRVQAEDQRADRVLRLARAPAHDHGVDRAHALDLHHARALARAGRAPRSPWRSRPPRRAASARRRRRCAPRAPARSRRRPPARRGARRRSARAARRRRCASTSKAMKRAGVSAARRSTRDLAGWMRWPSVSKEDATISPSSTRRASGNDAATSGK